MKSYLGIIPASARVRRKQNRMINICIILAVFLVTTIFSLADAFLRMETAHSVDVAGYWHIRLSGIQESSAESIAMRSDVARSSWYDVINLDEPWKMDKDYYIAGVQTALCGIDETFVGDIMHYFSDGSHVTGRNDIILTENAQELLGVDAGDTIILNTPAGDRAFMVSGFRISGNGRYVNSNGGQESALLVKENQIGAFMNIETFREICNENDEAGRPQYYIQFQKHTNLKKSIADIKAQYELTDDNIALNTILMAANGISDRTYINNTYFLAAILFVLIMVAGILMISSSLNSNVAQRLQFFGMLRCIGASKSQIIRLVRLEALNWCKTAVPIGAGLGVITTNMLNAGLRHFVGGEVSDMPVFMVSGVGVVCGAVLGIVTVFLAAQVPARRAAKVSPVAAVSGNAGDTKNVKHATNTRLSKVETALGIHHAVSAKKNLLLVTGSFAFSIILFLCFSVLIQLIDCLLPQKASAPDIDITSADLTNSIDASLLSQIREIDGVAHAFGRRVSGDVSAEGVLAEKVELISYDDYQLELLVKDSDLRKGSDVRKVYGDSHYVLAIWDRDIALNIGDKIQLCDEELEIAGMLKYNPFSNGGGSGGIITVISSEETFTRLTDITDYAVLDVQMTSRSMNESDEAVEQIRKLSREYEFRDRREENTKSMYYTFAVFAYGFVAIIALIALLNIINSISMSVSARINQYGSMRAVGMSLRQVVRMVAAEAFTYAVCGCAAGCAIGLPLSKYMYDYLITSHFYYYTWSVPVMQIIVVLLFVLVSILAAVYTPAKRLRDMSVTDIIRAQ